MAAVFIGLLVGFVIYLPVYIMVFNAKKKDRQFVENHKKICPGMTKIQVTNILGNNCTQSYLKSGIEKLEWRYRPWHYGRARSFTRKISVKFKDDVVVEVNCLNMDK